MIGVIGSVFSFWFDLNQTHQRTIFSEIAFSNFSVKTKSRIFKLNTQLSFELQVL